MVQKPSVVTAERFASGLTYKDYIAQVKVNRNRFEEYYGTAQLSVEDTEFFRKAARGVDGIAKILVLGEAWCPDVFRGMPLVARIAEAGNLEMRVFSRDDNLDIMREFLSDGLFMSIPVVVFYTQDLRYICHWVEWPKSAGKELAEIEDDILKKMPGPDHQEIWVAIREQAESRYPVWQQESLREIRQMLAEKLQIC